MRAIKHLLTLVLTAVMMVTILPQKAYSASDKEYNVLVLNFDPVFSMADNIKQHELMTWWNDPHKLAEEFISDMSEISYGNADYKITQWVDINEMPVSKDGQSYTLKYYYDTLKTADRETGGAYWSYSGWDKYGYTFDYDRYLKEYDVYSRVNKGELDEVWIFTGPMVGVTLYETRMIGRGTYWCNSERLKADCDPFVVYGFNYERGVGEMLEDAGHRAESIMNHVMGYPDYTKEYSDYTDWEKFTAYDKVAPGKAGVGNVHFAPNSTKDYEWGNTDYVYSNCEDWLNYPDMKATSEEVNCNTWGNGDIVGHHKWWFSRFPHISEVNFQTGFYNNWWAYFTLDYINDPPVPYMLKADGDVNDDLKFDIRDAAALKGWLLNDSVKLDNWVAGDLSYNGKLDVLDLCMMLQKLLNT